MAETFFPARRCGRAPGRRAMIVRTDRTGIVVAGTQAVATAVDGTAGRGAMRGRRVPANGIALRVTGIARHGTATSRISGRAVIVLPSPFL